MVEQTVEKTDGSMVGQTAAMMAEQMAERRVYSKVDQMVH